MRLKLALSAAVASLLFSAPVLAQEPAAPTGHEGHKHKHKNRDERMLRKLERMEHRLNRAVERGRLTQQQADAFLAEARQLRDDARAQLQAGGGQFTEEQKQQLRERKQALREKIHAAMKATQPQGQ
jgi:periplasmic protein CpxP/Spy